MKLISKIFNTEKGFLFAIIFSGTGIMYGQDSSARNAVGKQTEITTNSVNSAANENKKNSQSIKTMEVSLQTINGDMSDKKRNAVSEKNTKEEPK